MGQLEMFGMNIHLLIGLLACGGIGLIVVIILYVSIRAIVFRSQQKLALSDFKKRNTDERGEVLPPMGSGICGTCGKASSAIYFLSDGARMCRECYNTARDR
ncbi:MAG: hypothetical protein HZA51_01730 [Planctomycetes bacterium]|nr:hypothetical protein [Planctomycetota bacterium]